MRARFTDGFHALPDDFVARANATGAEAITALTDGTEQAGAQLQKAGKNVDRMARESPWALAGAALGCGVLLSAVGIWLFSRGPPPATQRHQSVPRAKVKRPAPSRQ